MVGKDENRLQNDWHEEVTIFDIYKQQNESLIKKLSGFLDIWNGHLGNILTAQHRIDITLDSKGLAHSALYRAGTKSRQFTVTKIDKILNEDIIEPTTTERAIRAVFAQKKVVSLCCCVDDEKLNPVTAQSSYALAYTDNFTHLLRDAAIFSPLDANSGYWKVKIDPGEREKTAFISHYDLFQIMVAPFWLYNTPTTF